MSVAVVMVCSQALIRSPGSSCGTGRAGALLPARRRTGRAAAPARGHPGPRSPRRRRPPPRDIRNEQLKEQIMRVREDRKKGRRLYGARKVWLQLRRNGTGVAQCTVGRLMRELAASPGCRPSGGSPGPPHRTAPVPGLLTVARRHQGGQLIIEARIDAAATGHAAGPVSGEPVTPDSGRRHEMRNR